MESEVVEARKTPLPPPVDVLRHDGPEPRKALIEEPFARIVACLRNSVRLHKIATDGVCRVSSKQEEVGTFVAKQTKIYI